MSPEVTRKRKTFLYCELIGGDSREVQCKSFSGVFLDILYKNLLKVKIGWRIYKMKQTKRYPDIFASLNMNYILEEGIEKTIVFSFRLYYASFPIMGSFLPIIGNKRQRK